MARNRTEQRDGKARAARMAIADLAAATYNPRRISEPALAGLSAGIARFGLVQPIEFNERTGRVVGGQQRLKVVRAQGEDQVDVMVVDHPESEEKALNVALNSGEFVQEDLDRLLEELKACEPELFGQRCPRSWRARRCGRSWGRRRA